MNTLQESAYAGMDGAYYNNENGLSFSPMLTSLGIGGKPEHHIEITTPDGQLFSLRLQKNILDESEFFLYHGQHIGKEFSASEACERPHSLKSYDLSEIISGENKYQNLIRDMKNSFLPEMNNIYLFLPLHDGAVCVVQMTPQEVCKFSQQHYFGKAILGVVADTFSSGHYPTHVFENSDFLYSNTSEKNPHIISDMLKRLNDEHCVIVQCEKLPPEIIQALEEKGVNCTKDESSFDWRLVENTPRCFLSVEVFQPQRVQFLQELPEPLKILAGFIQTSSADITSQDKKEFIASFKSPERNFDPATPPTFPKEGKALEMNEKAMKRRHNDPR